VVRELMKAKRIHEGSRDRQWHTMGENCPSAKPDGDVIWTYDKPLGKDAGFLVLRGTCSTPHHETRVFEEFRDRYSDQSEGPNAFEGRAIVFRGPEDYHGGSTILARYRRALHPVRARHPVRSAIPGRRGGEHAAACGPDQAGILAAALQRRWPPVRHIGSHRS